MNYIYNDNYDQEIQWIFNNTPKQSVGSRLKSKKFPYLKPYIYAMTSFLEETYFEDEEHKTGEFKILPLSLTSRALLVLNKIQEPFRCLTCRKVLKYQGIHLKDGQLKHNRFCCPHCECINEEVIAVLQKTNNERYHCDWTFQSQNNKDKSKITMNDRYHVDYAQQNKEIRSKGETTREKLYGNKHMMATEYGKQQAHINTSIRFYTKNLLVNEYVQPLFTVDEYIQYGKDSMHKYKWKCLKCNTEFYSPIDYSWFKQGAVRSYARCPKCFVQTTGTSYEEQYFVQVVQDILNDLNGIKIQKHRRILKVAKHNYEIDCYIPELKIGFEYNGIYYHDISTYKPEDHYHLEKTKAAEKLGIKLIHIRSDQWKDNNAQISSLIQDILNNNVPFEKYIDGYMSSDIIYVDRSIFNKCFIIPGYALIDELPPTITNIKNRFNYEDCGKLVFRKVV